jgi:hypothetical protein
MDTTHPSPTARQTIGGLMALATLTLACASLLHFGLALPLGAATLADPDRGAAIPEAVIATVLAAGVIGVALRLGAAWVMALVAVGFAVAGVLVGITFTLPTGRTGDIVYHFCLLALLLTTAVMLLVPTGRQALRRA